MTPPVRAALPAQTAACRSRQEPGEPGRGKSAGRIWSRACATGWRAPTARTAPRSSRSLSSRRVSEPTHEAATGPPECSHRSRCHLPAAAEAQRLTKLAAAEAEAKRSERPSSQAEAEQASAVRRPSAEANAPRPSAGGEQRRGEAREMRKATAEAQAEADAEAKRKPAEAKRRPRSKRKADAEAKTSG